MKTLSLKLPEALDAKLRAAAKRRRTTLSAMARAALEAYLNDKQKAPKGSFLDLAGDLIGSVEGPGDLATNPKYMEGYGR